MVDLARSWVRFRNLPDDILDTLPEHVRRAFLAARQHGFEIELLCAGATVPSGVRTRRRLVLVSDDGGLAEPAGPIAFDLVALAQDVRASRRVFIVGEGADEESFSAAYGAAIADLADGAEASLIVETTEGLEPAWVRTLTSMRSSETARIRGSAA